MQNLKHSKEVSHLDSVNTINDVSDSSILGSDKSIICNNISKSYKLYPDNSSRLKEVFHPLRKKFHTDFYAVKDVSFEVFKGETFGIVGKNGSGKSTLLQLLCGILSPSSGSAHVKGRVSALLELGAGFNAEFTGIENIYLNASILGLSKEEIDLKLDSIISFADIGDFINQPVKTYSSGMYVRLAFSVMANIDPEIFIVDEALAVGDAHFVHRCMNRFKELQDRGTTILFVSHDTSSIKRLCSRALWLHEGRLKAIGDSSVVSDKYLESLFNIESNTSSLKTLNDNTSSHLELNKKSLLQSDRSNKFTNEEIELPNVDKRSGSGEIIIKGANLYNENAEPISEVEQDSKVNFRLTIENVSNTENLPYFVGYILRDFKGIEIASTHSGLENKQLPAFNIGERATFRFEISIPSLYPGSYSLSPSISIFQNGSHKITDRIINLIVFKITSNQEMHVLLRLPTKVIVE